MSQNAARNAAFAAHKNSCSTEPMTHGETWSSAILIALLVVIAVCMIAVMIWER